MPWTNNMKCPVSMKNLPYKIRNKAIGANALLEEKNMEGVSL